MILAKPAWRGLRIIPPLQAWNWLTCRRSTDFLITCRCISLLKQLRLIFGLGLTLAPARKGYALSKQACAALILMIRQSQPSKGAGRRAGEGKGCVDQP